MTYQYSTPCSSTASVWRLPHSNASSPDFSSSKDEEDMDIDSDEYSPRTGAGWQSSSASVRSRTLFSFSSLHISEQNKPAPMYEKRALSKRAHSFHFLSAEKTSHLALTYSAEQSLCALRNRADDSDHHLSDMTNVSPQGIEHTSLATANEINSDNHANDTLLPNSLPQKQKKLQFGAKFFLFTIVFLAIAVAYFGNYVQSPVDKCFDHINIEALRTELQDRVYGQHIAVNVVTEWLEKFNSSADSRLLVMSFHGWTGIGKNFMSSIIEQHLPATNVYKFIIPHHFARDTYSNALLLSESILSKVTPPSCGLRLFLIDEIDKAHNSLVHSLRKTLSELSLRSDISCRAIFLLLTNDGATEINRAVTGVLMNGGLREDLKLADLMPHLNSEWYTELMSAKLIDQAVPFLPLERRHVIQCIEAELKLRQADVTQQLVDDIMKRLTFFPADTALFSSSGCRRISQLVDFYL